MEDVRRQMEVVLLKSLARLEVDRANQKMMVCIDLPSNISREQAIEILGAKHPSNRELLDLIYLDTWELVLDGQICPTYSGKPRKVRQSISGIGVQEIAQQYPTATIDWSDSKGLTASQLVNSKDWLKLVEEANTATDFERIAESSLILYRSDILEWLFDHKGVKNLGMPTPGKPLPGDTIDLLFNHYPRSLNSWILFELVDDPRCFSGYNLMSPLGWRLFEWSLENKLGPQIARLVRADEFVHDNGAMYKGVKVLGDRQIEVEFKCFESDSDYQLYVMKKLIITITDDTLECEIVSGEISQTYSIAIRHSKIRLGGPKQLVDL